jgi:hypothetical protein
MSSFSWTLDQGWENDLVDLMGSVTVIGTSGGQIIDDNINVDIFLECLLKVIQKVSNDGVSHAEVELIVEPEKLSATRLANKGVSLSYGQQQVQIDSLSSFRETLVKSIRDFLDQLPDSVRAESDTIRSLELLVALETEKRVKSIYG